MSYDWKDGGEEWSEPWGNSAVQWSGAIWPRIRDWLPANTILEIGPGYGRWTHYLKDQCEKLLAVDQSAKAVEACRKRFAADKRVSVFQTKNGSLSMIADTTIDFIFSFDVFVHIRRDVVEEYLSEFASKLKPGGKGFIHHSNLGEYANSLAEKLPGPVKDVLMKWHILDKDRHRTPSMTAELFRNLCAESGLQCIKQELVNWRGSRLIDCFSWFERTATEVPSQITRNPNFMREAAAIRNRSLASN
jgi:SAM-dependent methyltransferase